MRKEYLNPSQNLVPDFSVVSLKIFKSNFRLSSELSEKAALDELLHRSKYDRRQLPPTIDDDTHKMSECCGIHSLSILANYLEFLKKILFTSKS